MQAMSEPLLVALVGVGGVVAGAIGSGIVQAYLAHLDRRRAARGAARLLFVTLLEARIAMEAVRDLQGWQPASLDWEQYGRVWAEHRKAIARSLNTIDVLAASAAFSNIARIALIREDHRDPLPAGARAWDIGPTIRIINRYLPIIAKAEDVIWDAGFTWLEKRREKPTRPTQADPTMGTQ
jgi:hypothetical protein